MQNVSGVVHPRLVIGELPAYLVVHVAIAVPRGGQVPLLRHQVHIPSPQRQEGGVLLVVFVDGDGVVALLGVKACLPTPGGDPAGLPEGGLHPGNPASP